MPTYLDGDHGALQYESAANTFTDVAACKSMNIDTNSDSYDTTTWSDSFKTAIKGKANFAVSAEFVATTSLANTLSLLANTSAQTVRVYPHTVQLPNTAYVGGMYISGSLSVPQGGAMTGSISITAANNVTLQTDV